MSGSVGEYTLPKLNCQNIKLEDIVIVNIRDLPRRTEEEIRTVSDLYRQAAIIQGDVWEEPPIEWVPPHNMQAADEIGGTTIAAYLNVDEEGNITKNPRAVKRVVGMIFETPGIHVHNGSPHAYMYSHLMATDTEVKKRVTGIGFLMKRKQRRNNLEKGITEVRWTYDPLQSLNACVNIRKCGATASKYKRSVYDLVGINAGVEADRFEAVWPIISRRVYERVENQQSNGLNGELAKEISKFPCVNRTIIHRGNGNYRIIDSVTFGLDNQVIAIEIPVNFTDMIRTIPEDLEKDGFSAARDWRSKTRDLFEHYFERGYVVRDLAMNPEGRAYYLLEKGFKPE